MTQVVHKISDWRQLRSKVDQKSSIGFVPTMGALHAGHLSLIKQSRAENKLTVVSIFVNPTQFNNPDDLLKYPRTFEKDLELLKSAGVDYLFAPEKEDLYLDGYRYQLHEKELSTQLCGHDRPGHFDGVLTVVMKLFNLVQPQAAYFGEKDFQQLTLIEGMASAFFLNIKIRRGATVREQSGLALSSRNVRLTEEQLSLAPRFYELLSSRKTDGEVSSELQRIGIEVDYITTLENRRYGAIRFGEVRLIDNVEI